jgi:tripartite-type tricarboxylate transporter receptor subunit TctC
VSLLNREINATITEPQTKVRLTELGGTVIGGAPGDFAKLIADETQKWAKVIKFAGIKPE